MVEQLGFAMMPPCPYLMPFMASGFTSGMTRGTPSVILKAELLSTTCTQNTQNFVVIGKRGWGEEGTRGRMGER